MNFQESLKQEFDKFLVEQKTKFPEQDTFKMDLHCHDYNSDVPDELVGRLLNVPETWLESKRLLQELKSNGCQAFTITNHNNARSCYKLQDKGYDILTAAEFSCFVPDFEIGIHVLAYGFTPEQEVKLEKLRKNIYAFLAYTRMNDIPSIWAHPLYHYSVKHMPPMEFFQKMSLLFERFEVLNGQRDSWQNILVKEWLEQTTPEKIDQYAKKFNVDPSLYTSNPYRKIFTGGSDSHMGIFAGTTGANLYVPNLNLRLKSSTYSELALEAIKAGNIAPYGSFQNSEKLTITFLQYACQIALNFKDPGLLRLLLHKGETSDKAISLLVSNMFGEIQQHKVTMSFIKLFNESMMGKAPNILKKVAVSSVYKPVFDDAVKMAKDHKKDSTQIANKYYDSISNINHQLNSVLYSRLEKKLNKLKIEDKVGDAKSIESFIEKIELPSLFRTYIKDKDSKSKKSVDVTKFLDGLSFPGLASALILMAHFTSSKVLYNTRPFLNKFSTQLGKFQHPQRIMWLTDTFGDKNGVSTFLKELLDFIHIYNLPIDIVSCNSELESRDHLVVLKPETEFTIPVYKEQRIAIPNFLELHKLFLEGEYDRIVCSTEGVMGMFGLYLKHAYSVQASFYLHTDWLMFARKVLNINGHNLDRVRRILRFYYKSFDQVLVLNSDQQKWLTGPNMSLNKEQVLQTAHWVNEIFKPTISHKEKFGIVANSPVMLYVGRVSEEKGVLELPFIYQEVKKEHPHVSMLIVGSGPALKHLKKEFPEAVYLDWVDHEELPLIYSSADILVVPSRFDTFCNAVLESLSCATPIVAYNTKGPKDIIQNNENGFLVSSKEEMASVISNYFFEEDKIKIKESAVLRANHYKADVIVSELLYTLGVKNEK